MRSMMRLQAQLQDMTADELLVAMDEIAALDIPAEAKTRLEQMLMGPLLQKEPELGLSRFIDRISDEQNGIAWQLSNALKEWAAKEPGKASAWFDEQIAAGKFDSRALDGKSESRIQFEGAMISALLSTDPGAARRRLQGIPEDQRGEVLQNHAFQSIKEQDQLAFVGLVRSELPVGEQPNTISRLASRLVSLGSYEKVTAFLERIDATPEERTKSVESAAESKIQNLGYREGVTRGEIDSMREWVAAQAPGSTDRVTGKALARSLRGAKGIKFPEAAALARQYGASSGNDEVVVSFLEDQGSSARAHRDEARELANSIADVKRREEILKRLD